MRLRRAPEARRRREGSRSPALRPPIRRGDPIAAGSLVAVGAAARAWRSALLLAALGCGVLTGCRTLDLAGALAFDDAGRAPASMAPPAADLPAEPPAEFARQAAPIGAAIPARQDQIDYVRRILDPLVPAPSSPAPASIPPPEPASSWRLEFRPGSAALPRLPSGLVGTLRRRLLADPHARLVLVPVAGGSGKAARLLAANRAVAAADTLAAAGLPRPNTASPATGLAGVELRLERVSAGASSHRSVPRGADPLVRRLQEALVARGFDPGRPDGLLGPRTRKAIRSAERSLGLPLTGAPSGALARALGLTP
ncbi:peptidoglycan-binding domain-containing protein [Tistlia consotensis]|nr:peptidoglycan-binding domain-containing protein [Tistlia consotensis]